MIAQPKIFETQPKQEARNRISRDAELGTKYLPLCSQCKEVMNEHGFWLSLDVFMQQESQAHFVFGICPDCRY